MKNAIILLSVLFMITGCGGSGGDKATSTTPAGTTTGVAITGATGSTVTPTTSGVTPYSRGVNNQYRSELFLEFHKNSSGQVTASGDLELSQQVGFGSCILPLGSYDILTTSPGNQGSRVHNYSGITLSATGPQSFTALVENSLSLQNPNGEWVLFAVLKVQSVGGVSCDVGLSFGMPLSE